MAKKNKERTVGEYRCDESITLMFEIIKAVGNNNPISTSNRMLNKVGKADIGMTVNETVALMKAKCLTSQFGSARITDKFAKALENNQSIYTDEYEIILHAMFDVYVPHHGWYLMLREHRSKYAQNPNIGATLVDNATFIQLPMLGLVFWTDKAFTDESDETMFKLSNDYPA